MCKVCNESVFFEESWAYHDAGYGDTDYGGVTINKLSAIICPACGKIKPYGIEKYGSIENVLTQILLLNLSKDLDEEVMLKKLKTLLSTYGETNFNLLLEQNNLVYSDGCTSHNCGHILLTGLETIENIDVLTIILEEKGLNFCPKCGKKLLPLKTTIKEDYNVVYQEVKRLKTWDRSE